MLTPIPIGSLNWGGPLNTQVQELDQRLMEAEADPVPADQNLIAWSMDPFNNSVAQVLTSGLLEMVRVHIPEDTTVTNIILGITTAGSGLTAGQNFAGLYDSAGTRLGVSADQTAAWGTSGVKTTALTAPVAVSAGFYDVAFVSNGTTPPQMPRGSSLGIGADLVNVGLTAATARLTTAGAAVTALPASVVMASRTLAARSWWVALS